MRKRKAEKLPVIPDVRYNSEIVVRLINAIMERGKKSLAQRIVYDAFHNLRERNSELDPLELFLQALENVKPRLEVKSRRVGGATYQVPLEVPADRQVAVALRWIVDFARNRKGASMSKALADEIFDAFNNTGNAVRKRDDVHKMANANKAFAHFHWG